MKEVQVGTAVVAPLSGYPQLGIVVGFEEVCDRSLKEIQAVVPGIALRESLVKLCSWAAKAAALPLPAVLRMALPPGLRISTYEVLRPASNWPWKTGSLVTRTKLYRFLGGSGPFWRSSRATITVVRSRTFWTQPASGGRFSGGWSGAEPPG
jgi:primosomal protein N'